MPVLEKKAAFSEVPVSCRKQRELSSLILEKKSKVNLYEIVLSMRCF